MKKKRRIRTKDKSTTSKAVKKKKVYSGFDRGAEGFKRANKKRERQEQEYEKRKETPWTFWLKPGTEADLIILDSDEPFFVSLHKIKVKGKWEDEVCIASTGEECPLCESLEKEGAYTMVLTVLDKRPYKTRDGKTIKVSKKLMHVKGRNMAKFERQYKKHKGNFRGLKLTTRRDGDKELAMGEDLEFGSKVKESFLKKFKDISKPANYSKIFAMPSADELRKRYHLVKGEVAGSEEFDEDDDNYDMDDVGWD